MVQVSAAHVVLEVLAAPSPAIVQDGGRPGLMHQGVPPGGALVPELLAVANHAAGNPWHATALEIYGELTLAVRGGSLWVATDARAWFAGEGERIRVPRAQSACVRYLAVRGGIDVPEVLGGRGTLVSASIGGVEGRALRRGDCLNVGRAENCAERTLSPVTLDLAAPVRVILGPDQLRFDAKAGSTLLEEEFTVSPVSNRIGMRLNGSRLGRVDADTSVSTPMTRGAIQSPVCGELIVLGPDHPTTGGYPVVATVVKADLGSLAARQAGVPVRFRAVSLEDARNAWRCHAAQIMG